MIFVFTLLSCLLLLFVERLIGIGWDYHPDSVTYFEGIGFYKFQELDNLLDLSNTAHYFLVDYIGTLEGVVAFNIIITALGNQIIYDAIIKKINNNLKIILLIYLFLPYKIHLAITLLKDSFIIFSIVLYYFTRIWYLGVILGIIYRNAFIFYLPLKNNFNYKNFTFLSLFIFYLFYTGTNNEALQLASEVDMKFRHYDLIPSFNELGGILGAIVRSVVWPIITVTGLFIIISPTLQYFPIAIGSFMLIIFLIKFKIKIEELFPIFLFLAIFACIAPGYTTFTRYIFPVMCNLPFLLILSRKYNDKLNRNYSE